MSTPTYDRLCILWYQCHIHGNFCISRGECHIRATSMSISTSFACLFQGICVGFATDTKASISWGVTNSAAEISCCICLSLQWIASLEKVACDHWSPGDILSELWSYFPLCNAESWAIASWARIITGSLHGNRCIPARRHWLRNS